MSATRMKNMQALSASLNKYKSIECGDPDLRTSSMRFFHHFAPKQYKNHKMKSKQKHFFLTVCVIVVTVVLTVPHIFCLLIF